MKKFNRNSNFDEVMEYLFENADGITTYNILVWFAKKKIDEGGMLNVAIHILTSIYEDPDSDTWFLYDYSMGTLQTPVGVTEIEHVQHILEEMDIWEELDDMEGEQT